jgi:hypothetical protein
LTACIAQIRLRNVSAEYADALGTTPEEGIVINACLQVSAFLHTGKKSERLPGEPFRCAAHPAPPSRPLAMRHPPPATRLYPLAHSLRQAWFCPPLYVFACCPQRVCVCGPCGYPHVVPVCWPATIHSDRGWLRANHD